LPTSDDPSYFSEELVRHRRKIVKMARRTRSGTFARFLYFLLGKTFVAGILRAAIGYVAILVGVDVVGLFSPSIGALLTLGLTAYNAWYLYRLSEDRWTFVKKQALPVLVTLLMAGALNQGLDYAFSMLYAIVVFARAVGVS
jgi:hypothetical protein